MGLGDSGSPVWREDSETGRNVLIGLMQAIVYDRRHPRGRYHNDQNFQCGNGITKFTEDMQDWLLEKTRNIARVPNK